MTDLTISDLLRVAPASRPDLDTIDAGLTSGFDGDKDAAREDLAGIVIPE